MVDLSNFTHTKAINLLKMTKTEIIAQLTNKHEALIKLIIGLDNADFVKSKAGKWSAGQHLDHIARAINPITIGLFFPKFLIKLFLGKANRPSKTYKEVVQKYKDNLALGGVASGRFVPKTIGIDQKDKLHKTILKLVDILILQINDCTENELDTIIFPHPLLGRITLREMMYFTIYHAEHHQNIVIRDLK